VTTSSWLSVLIGGRSWLVQNRVVVLTGFHDVAQAADGQCREPAYSSTEGMI
jgi:hypothetical protein